MEWNGMESKNHKKLMTFNNKTDYFVSLKIVFYKNNFFLLILK
jgi:hypothetical protein